MFNHSDGLREQISVLLGYKLKNNYRFFICGNWSLIKWNGSKPIKDILWPSNLTNLLELSIGIERTVIIH